MHIGKHSIKLSIISVVFIIIISFFSWQKITTDWSELSSLERKMIKEYKKEIGVDYVYCMRVNASNKSYEAIIKNRKLTPKAAIGKHFPMTCKNAQWWDIPDYVNPEFSGATTTDSLDLITRINGIVYFTSEVW